MPSWTNCRTGQEGLANLQWLRRSPDAQSLGVDPRITVPDPQQLGGLYSAPNRRSLHEKEPEELLAMRLVYPRAGHLAPAIRTTR